MSENAMTDEFRNYAYRQLVGPWRTFRSEWPAGEWRLCHGHEAVAALEDSPCAGFLCVSSMGVSGWVMVFPPAVTGSSALVLPRLFVPSARVDGLSQRNGVDLAGFIREGLAIATDGDVVDFDRLLLQILGDAARFDIQSIVFDEWSAGPLFAWLAERGLPMAPARFSKGRSEPGVHGLRLDAVKRWRSL